ncbi:MAG: SGNH/GDSL hydrolase family protein [bacterium]
MLVSPHEKPPGSRTGVTLALILFGLGIGFLTAEVALRLYNPFGFRMRGNTIVLPVHQTYMIQDPNLERFDKLDRRVVHTKNSLGFRGPEPPRDFRACLSIVVIGGSTTECFYLSDGQSWPEQLQAQLQPAFPRLWVNNAGLDGHSTFGHTVLMRDYISKLRPSMALFLVGVNDLFADGPRTLDHLDRSPIAGRLAEHSELFAVVLNMVRHRRTAGVKSLGAMPKRLNLQVPEYTDFPVEEEEAVLRSQRRFVPEYESRLKLLMEMARRSGIEPVLITQPALFGDALDDVTQADLDRVSIEIYRKMNGFTAWRLLEMYNDVIRRVGREQGVKVIDLAREMPKSSRYYYDYLHYGKEGAAEVARIVAQQLCPVLASKWPEHSEGGCDHVRGLSPP